MDDKKIIELYEKRDESAITATSKKYGRYLSKISYNILADMSDVEECVNDTYLQAWNSIPPKKPSVFSVFLARITRFVSIDLLRKKNAQKRGSEYILSLDELSEVVSGTDSVEDEAVYKEMISKIDGFLKAQPTTACDMFVMRYFYADSIKDISRYVGKSEGAVKTALSRVRASLCEFLKEEGYDV